jgi:hypothetical protein
MTFSFEDASNRKMVQVIVVTAGVRSGLRPFQGRCQSAARRGAALSVTRRDMLAPTAVTVASGLATRSSTILERTA